jgi:hypothetical protein
MQPVAHRINALTVVVCFSPDPSVAVPVIVRVACLNPAEELAETVRVVVVPPLDGVTVVWLKLAVTPAESPLTVRPTGVL